MKIVEYQAIKDMRAMILDNKDLVSCVKAYRSFIYLATGNDVGLHQAKRFYEYVKGFI